MDADASNVALSSADEGISAYVDRENVQVSIQTGIAQEDRHAWGERWASWRRAGNQPNGNNADKAERGRSVVHGGKWVRTLPGRARWGPGPLRDGRWEMGKDKRTSKLLAIHNKSIYLICKMQHNNQS